MSAWRLDLNEVVRSFVGVSSLFVCVTDVRTPQETVVIGQISEADAFHRCENAQRRFVVVIGEPIDEECRVGTKNSLAVIT